jgi:hypothetical protein
MNVSLNDINDVQEAGDYHFRDGILTVTFAEIAVWKADPGARFELMQKHPIRGDPRYVLGRRIDEPAGTEEHFYKSSNGDSWSLARDTTTGSRSVIHRPNPQSGGRPSQLAITDFLKDHADGPEHQALRSLLEKVPRMRVILIAYDLHPRHGPIPESVARAIQSLGTWWHHLETIWIVQCASTPAGIRDLLKPMIGVEDQLLVIDISGDTIGWVGVNELGSKWLAENV